MNHIEIKLKRLKALRKQRPEYIEIYNFYSELCQFMQLQQADWLTCSPDIDSWEQRRQNGFPLLSGDSLQISEKSANIFFINLIDCLIKLGQDGKSELQIIAQAIEKGDISIDKLLVACLAKDRAPFETVATELKVPSALLEYVCSTALLFGLQQWCEGTSLPEFEGWQEGYCPICGGAPLMAELVHEEGEKRLHCSLCATYWSVIRLKCSYCGNSETDSLEYFTAEGEIGYRVDVCRKCSSYLKVVDSRELGDGLPMDVEDLNTMHLDLMAQKEGFAKGKRTLAS